MGKKTVFTNITPLPPTVTREVAVAMLHNHPEMIELNPLVIEHHPVKTPRDAPKDEFLDCAWYEMTDRISYLPGGMVKGKVTYRGCFHDLPNGLQTHVYAPMNLDIREKWTVCGTLPGEPEEARELGLNTPRRGLYLREDGEMKCNVLMSSFVRKNLDNSHKVLVERILAKAERIQAHVNYANASASETSSIRGGMTNIPPFQPGSHMGGSILVRQMSSTPSTPITFRPDQIRSSSDSATLSTSRSQLSSRDHHTTIQELPVSQPGNMEGAIQPQTLKEQDPEELQTVHPALREQYRQTLAQNGGQRKPLTAGKVFAAELEGSQTEPKPRHRPTKSSTTSSSSTGARRGPEPVEMDGGYTGPLSNGNFTPVTITAGYNDVYPRDGSVSEISSAPPPLNGHTYTHTHNQRIPDLAHMRSYSQPMIEANTYIDSASGAHNMESGTSQISAHPSVSGVGGVILPQSRFRGLSNSAGSGQRMDQTTNRYNDSPTEYDYVHGDYNDNQNQNQNYYSSNITETKMNIHNDTPNDTQNHNDRYSMVSEISDMPTPKADRFAFGTGAVDNRYSVVSAMTDGAPTPRMPSGGFAEMQRGYIDREREREMINRRGFI